MTDQRFDVLVVGSGPAGSIAALVLARGGARVALVDKAAFPRDKACGDLIGPRGVQLLRDLALDVPDALESATCSSSDRPAIVCDCPRRPDARIPATGSSCSDHSSTRRCSAPRSRRARSSSTAVPTNPSATTVGSTVSRCRQLAVATRVRADVIVGADGATSRVAEVAGLVDPGRVLWGFAVRTYRDEPVEVPHIMFWTPDRGQPFRVTAGCSPRATGV